MVFCESCQKSQLNLLSSLGRMGSWKYGSLVYSATAAEAGIGTEKGRSPDEDATGDDSPEGVPTKTDPKFVDV